MKFDTMKVRRQKGSRASVMISGSAASGGQEKSPCASNVSGILTAGEANTAPGNGKANGSAGVQRNSAMAKLRRKVLQQNALVELSQRALEDRNLTALLEFATSRVSKVLGVEFCKVLELLSDGRSFLLRAGAGWKAGYVGHPILAPGQESQADFTLTSSLPVIVEDFRTETRFLPSALLLERGVASGISVIIHGPGKPYGVLGAHTLRPRKFLDQEVHFVQSIANVLAAAVERSALDEEFFRVSDREQRRIGRDLHDGLCQQLVGIEFMNSVVVQQLAANPVAKSEAVRIGKLLRDVVCQARTLAHRMSPVQLESNGLMSALEILIANSAKLSSVPCRYECPQPMLVEDRRVATHVYHIAREALANAIKHGQAKSVSVALSKVNDDAILSVSDNGCGFMWDRKTMEGMGLRSMKCRAEMIHGVLTIDSEIGKGTTVGCKFRLHR